MYYFLTITLLLSSINLVAQEAKDLTYIEIDSLLKSYQKNKNYDKGISLALAASQKSLKQDSFCAEYLDQTAYFYELKYQLDEAINYYAKSLEVFEKSIGKNSPRYANTTNYLGLVYQEKGLYTKALELHKMAYETHKKTGQITQDFIAALNNIGLAHEKMGAYKKTIPLYIEAKEMLYKKTGEEHPYYAKALLNLATIYEKTGAYKKALPLYIQALNINKKNLGEDHPNYASSLNHLASFYKKTGDFEKALPLYIQAKDIRQKTLNEFHPSYAASLNNLALLYNKMGKYKKALPFFLQTQEIFIKALGEEHPYYSNLLNNLASLYKNMGNYKKALPLYIQNKNIKTKTIGTAHPDFATAIGNLANLYLKMKQPQKALVLYMDAKDIYKKALGIHHPNYLNTLNKIAVVQMEFNLYSSAWEYLNLASQTKDSFDISNGNITVAWAKNFETATPLSNIYLEQKLYTLELIFELLSQDKKISNNNQKKIIIAELTKSLLSNLQKQLYNEKDKLRILSQNNAWLQKALKVLPYPSLASKAFEWANNNKSILLLQATKSEENYHLGELPDSLISKSKKLAEQREKIQAQLLQKRSKEEREKLLRSLNNTNHEITEQELLIAKNYPKYYHLKYGQANASVQEIQALLNNQSALLEYVISKDTLHIFIVQKNSIRWIKQPVSNDLLKDNIKKLHNTLSNYRLLARQTKTAYQQYSYLAHWFYTNTIAPTLLKSNIKNLIIIPDGELGHLPFETFLVNPAPQNMEGYKDLDYLMNDYNISYNYSATLWKENKNAPALAHNNQLLAVAADYKSINSILPASRLPQEIEIRSLLQPLAAAQEEVKTLAKYFNGNFLFGNEANEKKFKNEAQNYGVIHLAMHGILDEKTPMLSSLAFTENKDSLENNFLQAYEISRLKLNADLVVLSACETGYGRFEQGEGILSIARSFMYAGTPSLVVSLWQVNDQSTSVIMQSFYQYLTDGLTKDTALSQAKLDYLKNAKGISAHPAFWSPFIQLGDSKAITIQKKGNWLYWGIPSLFLFFLGSIFLFKKNKKN